MTFSDLLKTYLLKAMANTQNRTYTKPEPRTLKAKTDMVNNCREWSKATSFVKSGRQYIFEIVRPWEERHKYYYDRMTSINGRACIVCKYKMYVKGIRTTSYKIMYECYGYDRVGKNVDGIFTFYNIPDLVEEKGTFVLSITDGLNRL